MSQFILKMQRFACNYKNSPGKNFREINIKVYHKFFGSTVNCFQQVTDSVTQSLILSRSTQFKIVDQTSVYEGLRLVLLQESN